MTFPAKEYCQHADCRKEHELNLLWLHAKTRRSDCLDEAMRLRNDSSIEVPCQRALSRGRPGLHGTGADAPLPERKVAHG